MNALFLDVDGVLNNHKRYPNKYCGIKYECVQKLNRIVAKTKPLIVLTSAWRYMILKETMTLRGFTYMLFTHGYNGPDVFDCTVSDEEVGTREAQIEHWLSYNNNVNWAVLDDLPLNINPSFRFVQTNGKIGLTDKLANKVIGIFNGKT